MSSTTSFVDVDNLVSQRDGWRSASCSSTAIVPFNFINVRVDVRMMIEFRKREARREYN